MSSTKKLVFVSFTSLACLLQQQVQGGVAATSSANNMGASSALAALAADDRTPPRISRIHVTNVTSTTATVTWVTNERADSSVEYGLSRYYRNQTVTDPALVTVHSQVMRGLSARTTYYYRVRSRDAAGNLRVSSGYSFKTLAAAPTGDQTAPTISLTAPAAGTTVAGTAVTVSASASDSVGVVGVQFQVDGTNVGSEDTSAPYAVVWDSTRIADGQHSLKAIGRDAAGNTASSADTIINVTNTPASPTLVRWGRIRPSAGTTTPVGLTMQAYRKQGVLVSETGISATVPVRSGRFYVEMEGRVTTGIAIANPGDTSASISFHFTDSSGVDFGQSSFTLPAKNQTVTYLDEAPFTGRTPMQGTFSFTSSVPVSVAALRGLTNERNEFLTTTVPITAVGQSPGSGTQVVPHVPSGGGWTSRLVLVNPLDIAVSGNVEFYSQGTATSLGQLVQISVNGAAGSRFPYTVPARGVIRLSVDPGAGSQVYSARLIPAANTGAPQAIGLLALQTNGFTVSEVVVPAVGSGIAFRSFAETSGVFGQVGSIQTGFAISNPSVSPVVVNVELVQANGTPTGISKSISVPGNGQVAQFISEVFPQVGAFKGVLRVTSLLPVHVIAMRGRYNERSEFLGTTMPSWNEAAAGSTSESVVPYIAGGDGYVTQLILFTGLPNLGATGELSILSPTGQVQVPTTLAAAP